MSDIQSKIKKEFKKEYHEHPWLKPAEVRHIVEDHLKIKRTRR